MKIEDKASQRRPNTSLILPNDTFSILFKEARRRGISVSALLTEEAQTIALKYALKHKEQGI
ncbi:MULTISPECIES: hypothetical protein [Klebsiella]|uniref:hypothetical protein n=1 Tax=Klebsiella TaxID=570 RepID=UPI001D0EB692|nr:MULTISPECIES: hypothetical protein [Klebsiella]